jgi:hypothetical protein
VQKAAEGNKGLKCCPVSPEAEVYWALRSSSKEALDDIKYELKLTKELAQSTLKQYNEAVASIYELLCNLLAGKPKTQWDRIMREMHGRDLWAGVNGTTMPS